MLKRFAAAVLGVAILCWSAAANAEFTYSFSDAVQSTVDFTTPSAMPKRACATLQTSAGAPDATVTSAATVAAVADVPSIAR